MMSRDQRISELETKIRIGLYDAGIEGTTKELADFYTENSHEYNEMLELVQYKIGLRAFAEVFAELQPNKQARILDCAAGSGYGGQQLHRIGYNNIDALDPSEGMLEIARSLNVYKHIIVDSVSPDKRNSIDDATYDAIIICGAVLQGHITLDCLPEITRMLKKAGTLTFSISDTYLQTDPNFQDEAMKKMFQEYIDGGMWLKWEVKRAPYRIVGDKLEECNIYSVVLV